MGNGIPVLIGFERSGVFRDAFINQGFDAWSLDLAPCERGSNRHICGRFEDHVADPRWRLIVVLHPPCTRLCLSGVRWLHKPPRGRTLEEMWADLDAAAALFSLALNAPARHVAVENPVMHRHARERIEGYDRARRQIVQPWWFGDPAFKATGWHLHNLPELTPTNKLQPPAKGTQEHKAWSAVHRASPEPERAVLRARSWPGMADAAARTWGARVLQEAASCH